MLGSTLNSVAYFTTRAHTEAQDLGQSLQLGRSREGVIQIRVDHLGPGCS